MPSPGTACRHRTSVVETSAASLIAAPPLTPMERHDFSTASPYVPVIAALLAFACDHAPDNTDAEATARTLMRAIYASCAYEPGSTNVSTTAETVLAERRGVCQDFAPC
jgi:transglutaminase-like putative cysteine protease